MHNVYSLHSYSTGRDKGNSTVTEHWVFLLVLHPMDPNVIWRKRDENILSG